MAITLPIPLTIAEIRILQEFRRVGADSLTREALLAIKHPTTGTAPALVTLVEKGYLASEADAPALTLTERGRELLARDVKPEGESPEEKATPA